MGQRQDNTQDTGLPRHTHTHSVVPETIVHERVHNLGKRELNGPYSCLTNVTVDAFILASVNDTLDQYILVQLWGQISGTKNTQFGNSSQQRGAVECAIKTGHSLEEETAETCSSRQNFTPPSNKDALNVMYVAHNCGSFKLFSYVKLSALHFMYEKLKRNKV